MFIAFTYLSLSKLHNKSKWEKIDAEQNQQIGSEF